MDRWLIVYSSLSGNTKSVAEAMLAAAPPGSVIKSVQEMESVAAETAAYGVVAIGYWLKRGGPDPLTSRILPQIENKKIILFETYGTMDKSEHAVTAFARAAYLLGKDCEVIGTFGCQGRINPALLAKRQDAPQDDPHGPSAANLKRWARAAGHPNEDDFATARDFVAAMQVKIERLARYRDQA